MMNKEKYVSKYDSLSFSQRIRATILESMFNVSEFFPFEIVLICNETL